jgi:hypothetical protein
MYIRLYAGHASGTIWWDDVTMAEGSWSELPPLAAGNNVTPGSITLPTAPQGGLATLSSGMRIAQVIERADLAAGTYTLGWSGTASARVYNAGTASGSRPAFAAGPIAVTLDGLDDVFVEFEATGGTRTVGEVRLLLGSTVQPFVPRLVADELAIAQRYYRRLGGSGVIASSPAGQQINTVLAGVPFQFSPPMRVAPALDYSSYSNLYWSDDATYELPATLMFMDRQGPERAYVVIGFASGGSTARGGAIRVYPPGWLAFDSELRKFAA